MSAAQKAAGGRVSDYVLPVVGIVPLLLAPQQARPLESPPLVTNTSGIYRQDLVNRVTLRLAEIRQLVDALAVPTSMADLIFVEDADHEPYEDAYTWQAITLEPVSLESVNEGYDDESPEYWR